MKLAELFGPAGPEPVVADPLLLSLLQSVQLCDLELERFLTVARSAFLRAFAGQDESSVSLSVLSFVSALAQQCFINEYVYALKEAELALAVALRDRLIGAMASVASVPAPWVALVGCYFPLGTLPSAERLLSRAWPDAVSTLLVQQVREPMEEQQYRASIPVLTPIEDDVSRRVRKQYEENPYPRWVKCFADSKNVSVDGYLGQHFPFAEFEPLGTRNSDVNILIAGCGTGQHPIDTALLFSGARILAIDLSVASLSYAKRKTREVGVWNIEYAQADILKLGAIGRSFDVIESLGVLHHLADPLAGWRVLVSLLRPGGLMHLGLYSARARSGVIAARQFIAERGYSGVAADIRTCRQELIEMKDDSLAEVVSASDFFGTSTCRDLLFHVQEHRFTLPLLKQYLAELGLRFIGFELDAPVRAQYAARFPQDRSMTNLDNWDIFESENPNAFANMYQFYAQKPR